MNKIKRVFISLVALLVIVLSSVDAGASTFRRKRKKERKDDLVYGKNWDKMDGDLDRAIQGRRVPRRRIPRNRRDNRSRYRRNRN